MANNATFVQGTYASPPANFTVRTDEVTSAGGTSNHIQIVKLAIGTEGSTAPYSTANPLPVLLQSSTATVTVQGGTTAAPLVMAQAPITNQVFFSTTPLAPNFASINVTASGIVTLVTSTTGAVKVMSVQFTALSSCQFQWMEGATAAASGLGGLQTIAALGVHNLAYSPLGHFRTSTGKPLALSVQGTSGGIGGTFVWIREPT